MNSNSSNSSNTRISFVGFRPHHIQHANSTQIEFWVKKQLGIFTKHAVEHFPRCGFITSGNVGVGLWAAETVVKNCPNPKALVIALACTRQDAKWSRPVKEQYRAVLNRSRVALVPMMLEENTNALLDTQVLRYHEKDNTYPYRDLCMGIRDKWMVDNSDIVCCCWDKKSNDIATIFQYALQQGKKVFLIDYEKQQVGWVRK